MRIALPALLGLSLLPSLSGEAAEQKFFVELNSAETVESRCRLNFVVQNKSDTALDSMKLDLAVFDPDGAIKRRLLTEMGPMRPLKTVVRTFVIDMECMQIRSLLVNDVVTCTPGNASDCIDELTLSSRLKEVRFYK